LLLFCSAFVGVTVEIESEQLDEEKVQTASQLQVHFPPLPYHDQQKGTKEFAHIRKMVNKIVVSTFVCFSAIWVYSE
jgi:hypothetical protein